MISEKLREELKAPFGKVLNTHGMLQAARAAQGLIISVGDRCTYDLLQGGISPHVCIFDFRCMREPIGRHMQQYLEQARPLMHAIKNPAGEITSALEEAVKECLFREQGTILVEGEDDLASLLVMARAPIGALLIYGQPNEGAVTVEISGQIRQKAVSLLAQAKAEG
ncbi:GTP-dependent dephospho-CoA kinase family protein [Candidatus Micrarchaeota archaeon]|nr:GTP-dependent dephospho-CoA kinase family protein [Candidatus Micrarchaeota archaeon]